jgi:hypothetical protein
VGDWLKVCGASLCVGGRTRVRAGTPKAGCSRMCSVTINTFGEGESAAGDAAECAGDPIVGFGAFARGIGFGGQDGECADLEARARLASGVRGLGGVRGDASEDGEGGGPSVVFYVGLREFFECAAIRVELYGSFEIAERVCSAARGAAHMRSLEECVGSCARVAEPRGFAVDEFGLARVAHVFAQRAEPSVGVAERGIDIDGFAVLAQGLRDVAAPFEFGAAFEVAAR